MSQARAALRQFRQFVTENPRVAYRWGMDRVLAELEGTSMPEDTRRDWTLVQENEGEDRTERLRVQGGWLYRVTTAGGSVALTFVPGEDDGA